MPEVHASLSPGVIIHVYIHVYINKGAHKKELPLRFLIFLIISFIVINKTSPINITFITKNTIIDK